MTDSHTVLQENVTCGKIARSIIDLLSEECLALRSERERQRVLSEVVAWIWPRLDDKPKETKPPITPMSDSESMAFEARRLTFGKFRDVAIREVPLSYLEWYLDAKDDLRPELRRYLLSRRVQDEISSDYEE